MTMQGDQVILRALCKEDSALLYRWISNRDLVLFNAPFKAISESEHKSWIDSVLVKRNDLVIFVIEEKSSGRVIGSCQLLNINWIHRSAELQIRIGETDFHGHGLGTEAIQLLLKHGFNDLNLHRIYLHVFSTNIRAVKAYEKTGFVIEGELRQAAHIDEKYVNVLIMAKLRSQ
jgi:RimJ/RimL family protein N-acetyltransferase